MVPILLLGEGGRPCCLSWVTTSGALCCRAGSYWAAWAWHPAPHSHQETPFPRIEAGMHTAPIIRIDVDAQERFLVTASHDKTARVWNLATGELLTVLRPPLGPGNEGKLFAVAIAPDGATVATAGWSAEHDHDIYLFDRASGRLAAAHSRAAQHDLPPRLLPGRAFPGRGIVEQERHTGLRDA